MDARETAATRLTDGWERGFSPGAARVLGVAAGGYRGLLGAREWLYARGLLRSRAVERPVVSVGNLTVGGTGKTPAVELAVHTLAGLGHRPAVISRGYGRTGRGIQVVADAATIRLDPEESGDEPFLLARRLPGVPVVVGANRHEAARLTIDRFDVTVLVLDDGFQHRTLRKDLEIVMARAADPWGNGRLLPGGPLREPLAALRRADLVVATGAADLAGAAAVTRAVAAHAPGVPVVAAAYRPTECWDAGTRETVPLPALGRRRLLAFAGIGAPAGFARTLAGAGVTPAALVAFADHHRYTTADLAALAARAEAAGADALITTEKDWIRLRRLPAPAPPLLVLGIRLVLVDGEPAWQAAFARACPRR
jgi:tetraacyldisaccharide 4'-kinase